MAKIQFRELAESWENSTYLSQIFDAVDNQGKKYVVKRNRVILAEEQQRFFRWLMETRPANFLIPLEVNGKVGDKYEEVYDHVNSPLLEDIPVNDLGFRHALRIAEQITSALSLINSQGFIHHDVRARNVFINPSTLEIVLFDYNSVSTPYFLEKGVDSWNDVPPEYRRGNCQIDFRFDVYQAGRLFFKMACGGDTGKTCGIPNGAMEIINKASGDLEQRYANCGEMHRAVESVDGAV